jgi:oligopeptide/dipeptide ABC transporter ATP-binding protein
MDQRRQERLVPIKGVPPSLARVPKGCAFHPRCAFVTQECIDAVPPLEPVGGVGHFAACVHSDQVGVAYEERFVK